MKDFKRQVDEIPVPRAVRGRINQSIAPNKMANPLWLVVVAALFFSMIALPTAPTSASHNTTTTLQGGLAVIVAIALVVAWWRKRIVYAIAGLLVVVIIYNVSVFQAAQIKPTLLADSTLQTAYVEVNKQDHFDVYSLNIGLLPIAERATIRQIEQHAYTVVYEITFTQPPAVNKKYVALATSQGLLPFTKPYAKTTVKALTMQGLFQRELSLKVDEPVTLTAIASDAPLYIDGKQVALPYTLPVDQTVVLRLAHTKQVDRIVLTTDQGEIIWDYYEEANYE